MSAAPPSGHAPAPGPGRLNIVESTLVSEAGHCGLLLRSLHAAAPALRCIVWAGRGGTGGALFADLANTELRRHFSRRLRKLQAILLYRRLLRGTDPLLVPTAGRFDAEAIARVAPGRIAPDRVFLYFHRLAMTPAKARALRRIAAQQPNLVMIGTTDAIEQRLRAAGFTATGVMLPLPPRAGAAAAPAAAAFRRVVVAGAARSDKGFAHAVEMVRVLAERRRDLPVAIQVSGDHYARHDPPTRAAIERLRALRYDGLAVLPETLDNEAFRTLFDGCICLQPYEPQAYADKISAITLDALAAGAPIVTIDGTWMAAIVRRHGCGAVAPDATPDALIDAVDAVLRDYAACAARAVAAARALAALGRWEPLLARLGAAPAAQAA